MKQPVYAIRDMLVEFHAPMIGVNDDQMRRDFANYADTKTIRDRGNLQLYKIGEYDTVTGKITGCEPEFLMGGMDSDQY